MVSDTMVISPFAALRPSTQLRTYGMLTAGRGIGLGKTQKSLIFDFFSTVLGFPCVTPWFSLGMAELW